MPILSGAVLVLLLACIARLLTYKDEFKRVIGWSQVYYLLPMYVLIALLLPIATGLVMDLFADQVRASRGLSPIELQDFDTLGVAMLSMLLVAVNIMYSTASLFVGMISKRPTVKRILFNVGVLLMLCSCIFIAYLYFELVVGAPEGGYPEWNF